MLVTSREYLESIHEIFIKFYFDIIKIILEVLWGISCNYLAVMIHEDFEFQLVVFESFLVHLIVHLESLIVCQV